MHSSSISICLLASILLLFSIILCPSTGSAQWAYENSATGNDDDHTISRYQEQDIDSSGKSLGTAREYRRTSSPASPTEQDASEEEEGHSVGHIILLYLPNRLLDLLDIGRARLRVGPGIAFGLRITDAADVFFGSYISAYFGLPGPRQHKLPRSPIGIESYNGAEVSLAKVTTGVGFSPDYSFTEIGLSLHPALVGADVGIDPWQIIDFALGLFCLDVAEDDF